MTDPAFITNHLLKALWRTDPGAWAELYGRIRAKDRSKEKLQLNYLQRKVLAVWRRCQEQGIPCRIIILKPRQKGSSTISGLLCYHTMRRTNTSACVIGGEYSQTSNLWKIIQNYHAKDTFDAWGNTGKIGDHIAKFTNGSEMVPETARDREAGRSGTFQFLLATEVARWTEEGCAAAADVLAGILKCVPTIPASCVIIESTAAGASGDYYERWNDAMDEADFLAGQNPDPGKYIRIFAPWFEFDDSAFRLSPQQKDEIQRSLDAQEWYHGEQELIRQFAHNNYRDRPQLGLTDHGYDVWEQLAWRRYAIRHECKRDVDIFNQDYPESAKVAFLKSGRQVFLRAGLNFIRDTRLPTFRLQFGVLERPNENELPAWRATSEKDATFIVFERPTPLHRYLISVDPMTGAIAPGNKDPDRHSIGVLRAGFFDSQRGWVRPALVARIKPPCFFDIPQLTEQVWSLAQHYGGMHGCLIVPEVNMDRGLIELLKLKGANIAKRTIINKAESKETIDLGFYTTTSSRGMIIDSLARAIREYDVENDGIDIPCHHALGELETFITKKNGRQEHEDGHHDDDVLMLAIGHAHLDQATRMPPPPTHLSIPSDMRGAVQRAQTQGMRGPSSFR